MALNPELLRQIRPMSEADLEAISAIEAATFPDPWPRSALAHEAVRNPYCSASVIEEEGTVAGYAFCWVVFEQAHLINIAIAPGLRSRGLGEALLVHVMRHATAQGAEVMHLEVRDENQAAIALYLKYGFTILGRKDKYYGDGAAAILMQKDLTKP
jgi:ribosomal-protein-alanine acetyltransferase